MLKFEKMTEEWLDFIAACRVGRAHDYDIVEGPMADDTIFNYVQGFIDGKYSRAAFWELAKFKYPTHQISFHTARALTALKFLEGVPVYENNSNLFFACSLIEYIARGTKNRRHDVVGQLGDDISRIYKYADVFHCEPIEKDCG